MPLHKVARPANTARTPAHCQIMSLLIEKGADPNARNGIGWSPLHLCVVGGNIDGIVILLAAGASLGLECNRGLTPLEYYHENKRVLPMLLRGGAPLPRSSHARWMDPLYGTYNPTIQRYLAKVAVAGSWAAYEKQHRAHLVRTFVSKFPRLPPDVIPTIVAFGFHTGDY